MTCCPTCGRPYRYPTGLTAKQRRLFEFVDGYIKLHGIAPSYEEMRIDMGLESKSGINRLVEQLQSRGWILREKNRARTIRIAEFTDAAA